MLTNNFREDLLNDRKKTEKTITYLMIGLYLFGVALSFHYQTYMLGILAGGLNLGLFLVARFVFHGRLIARMTAGVSMSLYMLQYIAQMHGMFEMHFWFFIMPVMLIFYMDWRVFVPFTVIVVIHHFYFFIAFLQGSDSYQQYFIDRESLTQLSFIYHMSLAVLAQAVSIWAAERLRRETIDKLKFNRQVSNQLDGLKKLTLEAKKVSSQLTMSSGQEVSEEQSAAELIASMSRGFSDASNKLIEETNLIVEEAVVKGNLSTRLSVDEKSGTWSLISESINHLLDSLSKPIFEFDQIAKKMSEGDLTARLDDESSQGDLKKLIENMNYSLDQLVSLLQRIATSLTDLQQESEDMSHNSDEMNSVLVEVVSAMAQISSGSQRQVNSIEEVSNTLEAILEAAQGMEGDANVVLSAVKKGLESSQHGQTIVSHVVSDMTSISELADQTSKSIQVLNNRSNEISKVLGVITEISSQTNLLALNAAIEAAQAGESGRGFAVVAEEIRKLAEDSRSSAKEIEKLIEDVKTDTVNATQVIEEMSKMVVSGVKSSQESAQVFDEIIDSSNSSYDLTEKIMASSAEQTTNVSNVVINVESVVVISEQTAAGAEEVSASAQELSAGMTNYLEKAASFNQMARSLKDKMDGFKL